MLKPEDVQITSAPWMMGYRNLGFFFPVRLEMQVMDLESGLDELYAKLQNDAVEHGGNVIVGFELSIDPYALKEGYKVVAIGSLCLMRPYAEACNAL